jgi:uncharacterized membrane protein YfcA
VWRAGQVLRARAYRPGRGRVATLIDYAYWPALWGVVVLATVLRSFTGFGFGLAAVPGLALFLAPTQAVVLTASLSLALGVQTFPQYRGKTPLRPLLPMFLLALVGTVLGARLLVQFSSQWFYLCIGVAVIAACVLLGRFHPRRRSASRGLLAGTGLISGLMGGAFAIPGPPVIIFTMATQPDPAASRALMIMFFSYCSLIALATYVVLGLVSSSSLWLFLLGYPAMWLGDKLGYTLFTRYGGQFYRRIALAALLVIGISITLKGLI